MFAAAVLRSLCMLCLFTHIEASYPSNNILIYFEYQLGVPMKYRDGPLAPGGTYNIILYYIIYDGVYKHGRDGEESSRPQENRRSLSLLLRDFSDNGPRKNQWNGTRPLWPWTSFKRSYIIIFCGHHLQSNKFHGVVKIKTIHNEFTLSFNFQKSNNLSVASFAISRPVNALNNSYNRIRAITILSIFKLKFIIF